MVTRDSQKFTEVITFCGNPVKYYSPANMPAGMCVRTVNSGLRFKNSALLFGFGFPKTGGFSSVSSNRTEVSVRFRQTELRFRFGFVICLFDSQLKQT